MSLHLVAGIDFPSRLRAAAAPYFLLGQNAAGAWAIRETTGRKAGLFRTHEAAIKYAARDESPSGVTIITPRADLGQGAYSVLAALVAEELDLAWEDIKVDPGPPSAAYYNGKAAAEGFPVAATDDGFMARNARVFGDVVGKFVGLQITGGSSTVPDAYEKMRIAGAAAREVLLLAAARQTGIAKADLKTRNGAVITPDGRSLSYASLAAVAARIDPPANARLKPESEWRYLGKAMRRIDIVAKSTGTATFGIDLRMPGMVYATVRTNPRLGGGMRSFDASAAEKSRGVIRIVPITGGVGVIADNTWRAFKAASLILGEGLSVLKGSRLGILWVSERTRSRGRALRARGCSGRGRAPAEMR